MSETRPFPPLTCPSCGAGELVTEPAPEDAGEAPGTLYVFCAACGRDLGPAPGEVPAGEDATEPFEPAPLDEGDEPGPVSPEEPHTIAHAEPRSAPPGR